MTTASPRDGLTVSPGLTILITTGSEGMGAELTGQVARAGFQTRHAEGPAEAREILGSLPIDLILMDGAAGADGSLDFCQEMADGGGPPVIYMGRRHEAPDPVHALENGADDFLTHPHDPEELLARIRAVLRRAGPGKAFGHRSSGHSGGPAAAMTQRRSFAGMIHDAGESSLSTTSGQRVKLTTGENRFLAALLASRGQILERADLVRAVRSRAYRDAERSIDNLVSRLRKKIVQLGGSRSVIMTDWGGGYRLNIAPEM